MHRNNDTELGAALWLDATGSRLGFWLHGFDTINSVRSYWRNLKECLIFRLILKAIKVIPD